MRRLWVAAVVLAVATTTASAQQPGRGAGLFLLTQKSVQDELKLSDEQRDKLKDFGAKMMEKFQGLRDLSREERQEKMQALTKEAETFVKETLKPEQVKHLRQIGHQQAGVFAFSDPEVAKALDLKDEQKDKIKTVREEAGKEMREAFQSGDREKIAEARKKSMEKAMEVLTPEQKEKWKELTGEPFKGEIRFGFGGGRPGGGRSERNKDKK